MVQFEYNDTMKRYDVKLPYTLADEKSMVTVAYISENDKLTMHRELSLELVKQIVLKWDEKVHMDTERDKKEAGEFDELFDNKPKNEKLTILSEKLQIPANDIPINYLNLSARAWHILVAAGINTISRLTEKSERDLLRLRNCGRMSLREMKERLNELDLTLKQTGKENNYGI